NIPQFALAMLALWKVGATVLILNPMYRGGELRRLIDDSRAIGFIGLDREAEEAAGTLAGSTVQWHMTTSDLDLQTEDDPRVFTDAARASVSGTDDLLAVVRSHRGRTPAVAEVRADDPALLTYTSGTTGPPKGALNTHGNVLSTALSFNAWQGIDAGDVVLAVAPLFHITGAVATAAATLVSPAPLVLLNRVHPEVMLEAFNRHRVTVTVGAITVYHALLALERGGPEDMATVRWLYSGGAPIPPSTVERFQQRF